MRSSTALILGGLASLASAASHLGTLAFPIKKSIGANGLSRRQTGPLNTTLYQVNYSAYYIQFSLGTPPQQLAVTLDTGSADFIVIGTGSTLCDGLVSCGQGTFDQSASSSAKTTNMVLNNTYGDGTNVLGNFITDTIVLDGQTVTGVDVAVAMSGNIPQGIPFVGIMGVGYDTLEHILTPYPNIMDSLNTSGVISSDTFSLWLDDLEASTGTILFGGIDTSKYIGTLSILNILPTLPGRIIYYYVPLVSMMPSLPGVSSINLGGAQTVLLDSGTSLMYLPQSVLDSLTQPLGLVVDQMGHYEIPCSAANSTGSISFQLGGPSGPSISVAISELVTNQIGSSSYCAFGIQPPLSGYLILGDTFLRSAYVLYNLQDNVIGIAQSNTEPGPANIIPLNFTNSGTITIPGATVVPNQVTPTAPAATTGNAGVGPYNPYGTASASAKKNAAGMNGVGNSVYLGAWVITGLLVLTGVFGGGMLVL